MTGPCLPQLPDPNFRIEKVDTNEPEAVAQSPKSSGTGRLLLFLVVVAAVAFVRTGVGVRGADVLEPAPDPRGFRFVGVDAASGEPLRYNPCAPVHYTINPALAPSTVVDDIHAAFEVTGFVSGIEFVFDGITDEQPTPEREPYQPQRYGDRWAPILIAFTDGQPALDGTTESAGKRRLGQGGSVYEANEMEVPVFVSGVAVFDGNARLFPGFGENSWGKVILHELGHVVGLSHYESPDSVMNAMIDTSHPGWGPGDRAGLLELGKGGSCIDSPDLPD